MSTKTASPHARETGGPCRQFMETTKMTDKTEHSQVSVSASEDKVLVIEQDGKVIADSRMIAEVFGKRHTHVLRAINDLECPEEFTEPNFGLSEYVDGSGRKLPKYDLTRDGFSLLVMGFTGKEAMKWKIRYIEAFNKMESKLRGEFHVPKTKAEALRLAADLAEDLAGARQELLEAQPILNHAKRLENSAGSLSVTEAAKVLKVRPKELFTRLSAEHWIYKRAGCKSWLGYQDKIQSGVLEHRDHVYISRADGQEHVSSQVKVTGKGLLKLAEIFCKQLHLIGAE
jgi:Rha family phage regulatory protein